MILRTERLVLREFAEDDWRAVLDYQRDPRYLRFYDGADRDEADAVRLVRLFLDWQAEEPRSRFQLAVTLEGTVIGNAGIRRATAGAALAEIGYEIAPAHWGRGYATEAARRLLEFGFRDLGLRRVWAHCVAENSGSARVLEKLGMRREGRLREHVCIDGRWWDQLLYGLLRSEWERVG